MKKVPLGFVVLALLLSSASSAFGGTRNIEVINGTEKYAWVTFLHDYTWGRDQTGTAEVGPGSRKLSINDTTNYIRIQLYTGETVHCDTTAEAPSNRTKYEIKYVDGKCWIVVTP
jgi:hypothetical protein